MDWFEALQVRDRACTVKTVHTDVGAAYYAALVARRRTGDGTIRHYDCPFCDHFHVGHSPTMRTLRRLAAAVRRLAQGRKVGNAARSEADT